VIRVLLPYHLRNLAGTGSEVELDVRAPVTLRAVLDELERAYPVLRGTIREYGTADRRPFVRFFACQEDLSHVDHDTVLPVEVAEGKEPFMVVGAMSGG
jgi:sulfur-carrier protein